MTQPTREEAFDALLREAAAWRLRQALAALREQARLDTLAKLAETPGGCGRIRRVTR